MARDHVKGSDTVKLHPTSDQGTEVDDDSCSISTLLLAQNALQQTIPNGGLGLPCCIYLPVEEKKTHFNKSSASLKELGSIPTDLLQVLFFFFFLPQSVWKEVACQGHMAWKGDPYGTAFSWQHRENSELQQWQEERSLRDFFDPPSVLTAKHRHSSYRKHHPWEDVSPAVLSFWQQLCWYEGVDIGRGDVCWLGMEMAVTG